MVFLFQFVSHEMVILAVSAYRAIKRRKLEGLAEERKWQKAAEKDKQ